MKFVSDRAYDVARVACPRLAEIKCYEQVCTTFVLMFGFQAMRKPCFLLRLLTIWEEKRDLSTTLLETNEKMYGALREIF